MGRENARLTDDAGDAFVIGTQDLYSDGIDNQGEKMAEAVIKRVSGEDETVGDFIHEEFTRYGIQNDVDLNYDEFCFAAEDADGRIVGVITGRAYYNEVHIGDLIVGEHYRRSGLGRRLVSTVEEAYRDQGYDVITLTTFGFQAPEFYKKLGYSVEFVRSSKDPKLSKYFLKKDL